METTIARPARQLPLPYVPELPVDFLLMIQSFTAQAASQDRAVQPSNRN